MKKYILAVCALLIAVSTIFYFVGYKVAYDRIESTTTQKINEFQTFFATISEIKDTSFTVKGMEINDINYRGNFTLPIMEETSYVWRGTELSPSELDVGDNISITFYGEILETDPAYIQDVTRVQLLDDEK